VNHCGWFFVSPKPPNQQFRFGSDPAGFENQTTTNARSGVCRAPNDASVQIYENRPSPQARHNRSKGFHMKPFVIKVSMACCSDPSATKCGRKVDLLSILLCFAFVWGRRWTIRRRPRRPLDLRSTSQYAKVCHDFLQISDASCWCTLVNEEDPFDAGLRKPPWFGHVTRPLVPSVGTGSAVHAMAPSLAPRTTMFVFHLAQNNWLHKVGIGRLAQHWPPLSD
jgi:hypothetical protein